LSINETVNDKQALDKNFMLSRFGQQGKVRKWLVGLLLCTLFVPAFSLYALPYKQSADDSLPPCHQVQDRDQVASTSHGSKSCCNILHQCDGNCGHACSDCFSTGHFFGLITLPAEPQRSASLFSLPVPTYYNGVSPTLLLRPPSLSG